MRILVLENEPSTARGGQELSLYDVCRGLAAHGHEIELCYTEEGDLLDGYRVFASRIDRVSRYAIDRARTARTALQLLADIWQWARPAPDLIYANQYQDSLYARALAMRFARPFVCHVRLPPPGRFCGQYRWGMRGAVRLIAISHATRREYIASGFREDRIDVVHNGLDLDEWRAPAGRAEARQALGIPEDAIVAGFAGRLNRRKGIEVLIDAISLLPAPWMAVIAGKDTDGPAGDFESELRGRASQRGVGSRCLFVGHLSRAPLLYAAADVTVLPSTWSEAFGRTLVESMACGTPAVGARLGGIPEILTGEFARGLHASGDARALADRLADVRGWRERDDALSARCREHVVLNFNLTKTVAGIEAVMQKVVAEWQSGDAVPRAAARLVPGTR
jgi:glycosyltransferase involved in cell wall biosynthesis